MRKLRFTLPLALSLLSLAVANPVMAQEEQVRMVTVTGIGKESVPTTLAQVQLGVEVQGETAEEVQQEAAQRSASVVELLRSRGVSNLQTTGIYLSPSYDYSSGTQQLIGYIATNSVSFRVPTEQAGTIMDEAVQAGATRIDGVSFIADDSAIASAQQQAIREATQDAQAQADAALSALGLSRDQVVGIQVNGAYYAPPIPYGREVLATTADTSTPTPVVGGEQEIQASVTLQISF
ncbi:MAG: SIMPL domain-containing protein [Cyanobacteria bacterium CRU_2_1]|nr:SIMPL domain-containing protein [Cyanobacteria bacterium RU_5_0]NJR59468.1 SIMPL domain-containing protein [Cyanobacteria bacterium CRU_2_1]